MKKTCLLLFVILLLLFFTKRAYATTVTVFATDDTTIDSRHPETNMNGDPSNRYDDRGKEFYVINRRSEGAQETTIEYALLRFDLASIPQNVRINVAKLNLFDQGSQGEPGFATFTFVPIGESWTERRVNWWSKPAEVAGKKLTFEVTEIDYGSANYQSYREWEIKDFVQDWVNSIYPNYGFYIKAAVDDNWLSTFRSKETNHQDTVPKLIIDYTEVSPSPTPKGALPFKWELPFKLGKSAVSPTPQSQAGQTMQPSPNTASNFNLEAELAQVITAQNIKTVFMAVLVLLALKFLLQR